MWPPSRAGRRASRPHQTLLQGRPDDRKQPAGDALALQYEQGSASLMARIRTIKPTFWGSRPVATLSRDARLLAIGLISFADDDGRFLAAPAAINGYVFPNDDLPTTKVRKWLEECTRSGL